MIFKKIGIFYVYFKFLFISFFIICSIYIVKVFWNWEGIGYMILKESLFLFRSRYYKERYSGVFLVGFICLLYGLVYDLCVFVVYVLV